MAVKRSLQLWLGTDVVLRVEVRTGTLASVIDVSSWALSFMVKRDLEDPDSEALLTKTSAAGGITVAGTFDANPSQNQQRALVQIEDGDTADLDAGIAVWEIKRMDEGLESIVAYGPIDLLRSVHRA